MLMTKNRTHLTRARRLPISIPITASTLPIFLESEIMNLSKGGVFIRSDITLPLGTEIDFQFRLPGTDRVIEAKGTVVWTRKAGVRPKAAFPHHPSGMGVQFKEIDPKDVEAILDTLEKVSEKS